MNNLMNLNTSSLNEIKDVIDYVINKNSLLSNKIDIYKFTEYVFNTNDIGKSIKYVCNDLLKGTFSNLKLNYLYNNHLYDTFFNVNLEHSNNDLLFDILSNYYINNNEYPLNSLIINLILTYNLEAEFLDLMDDPDGDIDMYAEDYFDLPIPNIVLEDGNNFQQIYHNTLREDLLELYNRHFNLTTVSSPEFDNILGFYYECYPNQLFNLYQYHKASNDLPINNSLYNNEDYFKLIILFILSPFAYGNSLSPLFIVTLADEVDFLDKKPLGKYSLVAVTNNYFTDTNVKNYAIDYKDTLYNGLIYLLHHSFNNSSDDNHFISHENTLNILNFLDYSQIC